MPRIPEYDAAGTSLARTNTPRFTDRSSEIREQGAQALLGSVNKVMGRVVEHDDQLRYAAARSTLLQAQMTARKELEADPDHATFEARFRERMGKAQGEAGAQIRGARSREAFEAQAQDDIERGVGQVQALARGVETRQGIATLNDVLETNRNAALESKDPEERGAILTASYEAVRGALGKRYIDEAQAGELTSKYRSNFAESFVGIQSPADRIEMLSNPEGTLAKHIAPDKRHALLEAAKNENSQVRVMGESQALDDAFAQEYGNNFSAALKAAAEIKDPQVRAATESRTRQRHASARQFEMEDREDANDSAQSFILEGGKFADLPLSVRARMKPGALASLRAFAEAGNKTETDPRTLLKLSSLQADDPQAFGELDMMEFRSKLDNGDWEHFVELQRKTRTGQVDGKDSGYTSITQARDATLRATFGATTAKGKDQEQINDFVVKFERQTKAFKQANGRAPSTDDARAILANLTAEVVVSKGFFGGSKKAAYELTDEETEVPQAARDRIIAELRRRGKPVNLGEIQRWYSAPKARAAASTTPISDAIDAARKAPR